MDLALQIDSKVCYYDILGVDFKATEEEIKRSYKQLALKIHPDKVGIENAAVCTRVFQKLKDAYQCLSSPRDRQWYDSHRKFILKEAKEQENEEFKSSINIWTYFSVCYNGFTDLEDGFYSVYRTLFDKIAEEELLFNSSIVYPSFGNSSSPWEVTQAFYKFWLKFTTYRPFSNEYNLSKAENRQIRRMMEKENKKKVNMMRKEFSENMRKLCSLVKKRDPRVELHYKEIGIAKAMESIKIEKQKISQDQANKSAREERYKNEQTHWEEIEREKERRAERGQIFLDESDECEDTNMSVVYFVCEPCNKTFKSEKQLESHTRSKKHLSVLRMFE